MSGVDSSAAPCLTSAGPFGSLDCPLSPSLLPTDLRVLPLNDAYNRLLQSDSLPATLTFLQLGCHFDQPLAVGVLPASLVCLTVLGCMEDHHQLLLGALPAPLKRLRLHD